MGIFNGKAENIEDNRKKVTNLSDVESPQDELEKYPSVYAVRKYAEPIRNDVRKHSESIFDGDNNITGFNITVDKEITRGNYITPIKLYKGQSYTYKNNADADQTLELFDENDTKVQVVSNRLVKNQEVTFSPNQTVYGIGGWYNSNSVYFTLKTDGIIPKTELVSKTYSNVLEEKPFGVIPFRGIGYKFDGVNNASSVGFVQKNYINIGELITATSGVRAVSYPINSSYGNIEALEPNATKKINLYIKLKDEEKTTNQVFTFSSSVSFNSSKDSVALADLTISKSGVYEVDLVGNSKIDGKDYYNYAIVSDYTGNIDKVAVDLSDNAFSLITLAKEIDGANAEIDEINSDLNDFLPFYKIVKKTITKGNYITPVKLHKGLLYKYTNKSTADQELALYDANGNKAQIISSQLVGGKYILFIPTETYYGIGGWYNSSEVYFTLEKMIEQVNSKWSGKKWVSYGDSVTREETWQPYVVQRTGLVLTNAGVGGSCVADGGDNDAIPSFTNADRISALPTDADVITIMGGTNDYSATNNGNGTPIGELPSATPYDKTTFKGALCETVRLIQNQCPNALIIIIANIGGRGYSGQTSELPFKNNLGLTSSDYAKAAEDVANYLGIPFIDTHGCGINTYNRTKYMRDSVHPNALGGELIARKVNAYFMANQPN